MTRVTLDTNVIVSALNYPGVPYRVLELARWGSYRLQTSAPILDETVRILQEKFGWPGERAARARSLLLTFGQKVVPHIVLDLVKRDPDDNRILECAQASQSDYIITSDKDLLELKVYAGAAIVKPLEYLAIRRQRHR